MNNQSSSSTTTPDVVVVGAGLAGLAAASLIRRRGHAVRLYEKRNDVGGQARSTIKDGFTFNQGPHALYRGGPAERVLRELGVALAGGVPAVKGRVVIDGRPEIAPSGPGSLFRTKALGVRGKIEIGKLLGQVAKLDARRHANVSVDDWIAHTVDDEGAATLLGALVRLATYVNQPDQLSAEVAIAQLQAALGPGVLYLDNGWQQMVDQLRTTSGVEIVCGEALSEIPDARVVIVAVGNPAATSALTGTTFDVGPSATASCLDLGLSHRPRHDVVIGGDVPFYFSNHSAAADLAPHGQFHAAAVQYLGEDDEPDSAMLEAFPTHAGVEDHQVLTRRRLHRMTTVTAIATAAGGGLAGRPTVSDTGHANVFMAGDWVGPVGHLADASFASAEAAARAALGQLAKVPA